MELGNIILRASAAKADILAVDDAGINACSTL
jgi:hypothetical protein